MFTLEKQKTRVVLKINYLKNLHKIRLTTHFDFLKICSLSRTQPHETKKLKH